MSSVNIIRAVDNIRSGTNIYTPLVEVVVNAIQAIEASKKENGLIAISVIRGFQSDIDGSLPSIEGFNVKDNGVGFTDANRDAFDTLYTDNKISEGGKGFGRFTCLKYFDDLLVESVFQQGDAYFQRSFKMGKQNDIIVEERIEPSDLDSSGSIIKLVSIRKTQFPDKSLDIIARVLVEKLLPFFCDAERIPPKIILKENDEHEGIVLNDFIKSQDMIQEIGSSSGNFSLNSVDGEEIFQTRVFKFYSPRTQNSKVSLVAHRREVTSTSIHKYIPEFVEEFFDKKPSGERIDDKNFILKVYVTSNYLDRYVSLERGGFEFQKEHDMLYGISQVNIESDASVFAKKAVAKDVNARAERKADRINDYVLEKAPWHTHLVADIDLTSMPYKASDEQIENTLQKKKFEQEVIVRNQVRKLLQSEDIEDIQNKATEIVTKISNSSKNDLAHYIALRKSVIDLFERSLEIDEDGKYSSEGLVHDIIFPRRQDSVDTPFEDHNLWLVDERLNFTKYVSSDLPLEGNTDRPDLIAYDHRVVFRGENEASNPITIFEFKKPQRHDFVNPSSDEDPVQQIIRYVRKLREGQFTTPKGREILIGDNTPFYGFVVCDLPQKVRTWLEEEKDFKPMPDRMGYFKWHESLNLYIEVIGWDKVLKDASMRNRVFFYKLGIE